jgi:hypothetical protein
MLFVIRLRLFLLLCAYLLHIISLPSIPLYILLVHSIPMPVAHSFQSTIVGQPGAASIDLNGRLVLQSDPTVSLQTFPATHDPTKPDIIEVDTLMTGSGREFVDKYSKTESWRHSGTVILFKIRYKTLPHSADGTGAGIPYAGDADGKFAYSYEYQATPINGTDFKAVQYVTVDENTRTVYNRHGIKIYVVFSTI